MFITTLFFLYIHLIRGYVRAYQLLHIILKMSEETKNVRWVVLFEKEKSSAKLHDPILLTPLKSIENKL